MKKTAAKNIKYAYSDYLNAATENLEDIYSTCSTAKHRAYNDCWYIFHSLKGKRFRIISHNTFSFSVGFLFTDEKDGECFCWVTKDNWRYCPLSKL